MKRAIVIFVLMIIVIRTSYSQCVHQVTNLSDTSLVNGVNVLVTSSGDVDVLTTYCINTFPYRIGSSPSTVGGTGSYTFTFFPPVTAVTLNFSGLSDFSTTQGCCREEVKLFINGNHYSIPSMGAWNACDAMAVLTPSGDITGCAGCSVSGWAQTTINGTISTLTVLDTMVLGNDTHGSLFSLFICDGIKGTGISNLEKENHAEIFPNPASTSFTIETNNYLINKITLYTTDGRVVKSIFNLHSTSYNLDIADLSAGIYVMDCESAEGRERVKVVKY